MKHFSIFFIFAISFTSCKESTESTEKDISLNISNAFNYEDTPSRFTAKIDNPEDMVWIPEGELMMDINEKNDYESGKKPNPVRMKSFFMDTAEVTNTQFKKFIEAANYLTTAEKKLDWKDLKKQLPPDTHKTSRKEFFPVTALYVPPNSSTDNRMNHPFVHITNEDAIVYCKWV